MKNRNTSAFTLIELLVVVSIIALLVSILLPALSKAKEAATTVKCAVQIRNMAIAMHMYSSTYDDFFPALLMPGDLSSGWPGFSHWHQLVMPFAGDGKQLQCPTLKRMDFVDWDNDSFLTGFGLNYNGANWKYDWQDGDDPDGGFGYIVPGNIPSDARGGCIRSSRVSHQSEFIMIGDSNDNDNFDDPWTIINRFTLGILGPPRALGNPNPTDMPTRHRNGANIAFMDGHAKWYSTVDLLSDGMLRMWSRGER